jgi:hypothetical protein
MSLQTSQFQGDVPTYLRVVLPEEGLLLLPMAERLSKRAMLM